MFDAASGNVCGRSDIAISSVISYTIDMVLGQHAWIGIG